MKKETWLKRLMGLGSQVPKGFKPKDGAKIEDGETEIGKLTPNLVSLFGVMEWLTANLMDEVKKHERVCRGDDACNDFHRRAFMLKDEIDAVRNIFYTSLRHELGINPFDHPRIGIREGDVVVSVPKKKDEGISMLGDILVLSSLVDALKMADLGRGSQS